MRTVGTVLGSLVALVVAAPTAGAITWGQPDGDDHPHVVTLLFVQDGEGYYSCTGTLLSPTVVLTAGHCTEGSQGAANDATWVTNEPDPLADYVPGTGVEAYLAASDHWVEGDAIPHPDYDSYSQFPDTYDIGLVVLDEGIDTGGVYGTLPELGFLDSLATAKGSVRSRQVVIVGYGLQGTVPGFAQDDYERYAGTSSILGVNHSDLQSTQTVQMSNAPGKGTGSGGTCSGDSGGPAFWIDPSTGEETTTIVAVNSYGITGHCVGVDFMFRTDTAVAQDFVTAYL